MKKEKLDILYLGIPNVCFSLSDKKEDKYKPQYVEQRKERGFDDTEMWGLHITIAKFILPRLIRFRDIELSLMDINDPKTKTEKSLVKLGNKKITNLNKAIKAFEHVIKSDDKDLTPQENAEYKEGIKIYNKIFLDLWN